jgi:hypothetical protein
MLQQQSHMSCVRHLCDVKCVLCIGRPTMRHGGQRKEILYTLNCAYRNETRSCYTPLKKEGGRELRLRTGPDVERLIFVSSPMATETPSVDECDTLDDYRGSINMVRFTLRHINTQIKANELIALLDSLQSGACHS